MKKDKILKSSLSTLLKRFSNTDLISSLSNERNPSVSGSISLDRIKDNSILKNARINKTSVNKICQLMSEKQSAFPITVIQRDNYFEVVYPRINYIAALKLHLENVNCYVIEMNDDDSLLFLAAKLLQDKDSNIVEMSLIFNKIKKRLQFSQKEIASAMGLSRSQVTNIMRLIKMPKPILDDIVDNKLSFGHARAISTLNNDDMMSVVSRIYSENLSVHDVETIVYDLKHKEDSSIELKQLSDKYGCISKSTPKQVSFSFKSKEEKEKFINQLLKTK